MNWRALPIVPTIIVFAAAAVMVALGIWQLGRSDEKAALIARYSTVDQGAQSVDWPTSDAELEDRLYRTASVDCVEVIGRRTTAATAENGAKGLAQIARCRFGDGSEAEIALGFTRQPLEGDWAGGRVTGVIAPGPRLVASPPAGELEPLAKPDPRDLPNNHLAYAGQWFFFALTALVIYFLAIRKRFSERREEEG